MKKVMGGSTAVSLFAAGLLTPAAGAAQATPATDTVTLPEIVVSATRVPLSIDRVPVPVTVFTGADLRTMGIRTVAEALRTVPSAAVVRSGGSGAQTSLFLRGGESDYVKVFVDGVALNEMGGAVDLADLSTDQVERIEVVRGPVSVLYGSDAVTGSVHVFTRSGSGPATLTVSALGGRGERILPPSSPLGSYQDHYGLMDLDATLSGRLGALSYAAGGARSWSGGAYAFNNERDLGTGTVRLGWAPAAGSELGFSLRHTASESHFPTDGAGNLVDENALLDRSQWTASFDAGQRLGEVADLRLQLGLVTRDQESRDIPDGPADTLGVFASSLASRLDRRTADLRSDLRFPRSIATLGLAAEWADAESAYESESSFGPFGASAEWDRFNLGYYAQLLSEPLPGLSLTAGGRVDDNESFGTLATYRVGGSFQATPGTRLRGAIGTAFRAPTFAESFGSGFGDLGNPDLSPERTESWEVGVEQAAGPARITATWFDQTFQDLIQFTFSPPAAGEPNYFNVGAARAHGLETTVGVGRGGLTVSGSYTRLWTEVLDPGLSTNAAFQEGEPLLRRPAHSGSLAGRFAGPAGSVSLTLNVMGEREDLDFSSFPADRVTLASYATLDLAGEYRLPWAGPATDVLLRIDNALDTDYTAIAGFPGIGRVIRMGARMTVSR